MIITVLNIYGVKLVSIINNTGVVFEILGMVVFALIMALFHNNQGVGVLFHAGSSKLTASNFLVGMFMSLFVIYGFDTAATLAEETKNPRAEAPKAVLGSIVGAFVIGAIFLVGTLMAIPSLADAQANFFGPAQVIDAVFSSWVANLYLLIVVGGRLRVLHVDHDLDDPAGLRHGARRPAAVLEDAVEGQPAAAHADRGVRRCRRARGDPVPPVRGRDGDRRRPRPR